MIRIFILLGFFVPCSLWAAEPEECSQEVYQGRVPVVSPTLPEDQQFLCYEQFSLLHSAKHKTATWVAEALTPERVTTRVVRKDAFRADPRLDAGRRAELNDYKKSGYARGHMAPSGDMSTPTAQKESFSLANMVPQNSRNNSGPWKGIEDGVRKLAEKSPIFVVTGPIYLSSTVPHTIGANAVSVPDQLYKAIYQPDTNLAGVYILSNEAKPTCRIVTAAEFKNITGMQVFPSLPPALATESVLLPHPKSLFCSLSRFNL